ncbi:hypothetical protein Bca52824_086158 [Brassica carinata]|uniref:F-box associated beta-propeller type 1 domain-containing protein n=1 Tax=Brassica carinata TaxID=52824 RepID=A0A8X7P8H1_BRACI|nr:hypothetical protein Bca52824_086158 [Brassica carinata]
MSLALTLIDVDNHDWDISARGVSVKGNAYWVAKKNDNEFFQFILSFDFTRERFGLLPLPYESDGYDYFMTDKYENTAVLSVVRDEQLSVLHHYLHRYSLEMKIWMSGKIETKEMSCVGWGFGGLGRGVLGSELGRIALRLSLSVDPRRDDELSTRRTVILSLSVALLDGDEKPLFAMRLSLSVAPTRRQATAFSQWRAVDDKNADSLPLCGSPRQRQTAISPRI